MDNQPSSSVGVRDLFQGEHYAVGNSMQAGVSRAFFAQQAVAPCEAMVVLDAGCGDGLATRRVAAILASKGCRGTIYAFDASPTQIDVAQRGPQEENGFRFVFAVATFDNFMVLWREQLAGRVDLAVSSFALHFCGSLKSMLRSVHELLRPGGALWAIYPAQPHFVSEVVVAMQQHPTYGQYLQNEAVQHSHPNGFVLDNGADFFPSQVVVATRALYELGYARQGQEVAMVQHTHQFADWDTFRSFVRGLNYSRARVPKELQDAFDTDAAKAMQSGWYCLPPTDELLFLIPCMHIVASKK